MYGRYKNMLYDNVKQLNTWIDTDHYTRKTNFTQSIAGIIWQHFSDEYSLNTEYKRDR